MTVAYIIAKYSYTKNSLFHPTKVVGRYGEERLDSGAKFLSPACHTIRYQDAQIMG